MHKISGVDHGYCRKWRAVALKLHQTQNSCLIFPNPEHPQAELLPQSSSDEPRANIANVIRAVISADSKEELQNKLEKAKGAAFDRLFGIFTEVLSQNELQNLGIDRARWQQQQNDVLEIFQHGSHSIITNIMQPQYVLVSYYMPASCHEILSL